MTHEHAFKVERMLINGPRETSNIKHMQLKCDCGFMLWCSDPLQTMAGIPIREMDLVVNEYDRGDDPF